MIRRTPFHRSIAKPICRAVWALMLGMAAAQTFAQEPDDDQGLTLRPSERLAENVNATQAQQAPIFVEGDRMSGRPDLDVEVEGQAELRKPGLVIKADSLRYDASVDTAYAQGHVLINRKGDVFEGSHLQLELEAFEGFFSDVRYGFLQTSGHGEAKQAEFVDPNITTVRQATYTTCSRTPGPSWLPAWFFKADSITFDTQRDVGKAEGAYLEFMGLPLVPVPPISFPLSSKRRSGLLAPTFGFDSLGGFEYSQPYYWNIAPNYDATITPTWMTARGVDINTSVRYLEPHDSGELLVDYMASDKLRSTDRWAAVWRHAGSTQWADTTIGYKLDANRVSDNNYWSDFTRSTGYLNQRVLPIDAQLNWGQGDWSVITRVVQWQTLQVDGSPITPPYDRMPDVMLAYGHTAPAGWVASEQINATRFELQPMQSLRPNTQRLVNLAQLSYPVYDSAGYVTPKLQLHSVAYQFDQAMPDGRRTMSATVPTFSLDAGLRFERPTGWGDRELTQTLEPRMFYVKTPYLDQSILPNFDTAALDFSFASIWTENAYVGNDKIADNNLLTLGATTRYLDAQTGAQWLRFGIAQRYRLEEQRVTLLSTDAPAKPGYSDVLLGADANLTERWMLSSIVQYNPKTDLSMRSVVGVRYHPGDFKTLNVAYRFQRDLSEQLDTSWQWPLFNTDNGHYHSVGRLNYSADENRLVYALLGLEYDAGCWVGRVVVGRTQTSTNTSTDSVRFELEFVGFSRLGNSPQQLLKTHIGGYQPLYDQGSGSPSRFGNYE